MLRISVIEDAARCQELWQRVMPQETINDFWEARECFHRHFRRPLHFILAEDAERIRGLLPLVWVEEKDGFAYFPGETWQGKTWLEQNRIVAENEQILRGMLESCPSNYHLRYLLPTGKVPLISDTVDETGYLFYPPQFDYDMEKYYQIFSHKSAKRLAKELTIFESRAIQFRYDDFKDFDVMVNLNISRYGTFSYFYDSRFREGFRDMARWLAQKGWLRMTAIVIDGESAAVDMGCLYNGIYTLLAGGTNGEFPGIAKLMNTHHMQRACRENLKEVDFLCGDFSWKKLFHLSPRPLYVLSDVSVVDSHTEGVVMQAQQA